MNLGNIPATTIGDPRRYGQRICQRLRALHRTYSSEIDIIAHSMGGISSRWCIQELDGARMVDDLMTLGTPHQGVKGLKESTGWLRDYTEYIPLGAEALEEGSPLLTTLNEPPLPKTVDFTAVWSRTDWIFLFSEWAGSMNGYYPDILTQQDNVKNIEVPFFEGHVDLISSKRVFKLYRDDLD
jgi:triacylglycerol lipase